MEQNKRIISYLERLHDRCPSPEHQPINKVIHSLSICPIPVNLEDSLDLIGVDEYLSLQLRNYLMDQTSMCRRTAPWHGKCCSAFTNRIQENSRKWIFSKILVTGHHHRMGSGQSSTLGAGAP